MADDVKRQREEWERNELKQFTSRQPESKARQSQAKKDENDKENSKTAHIRRGLPPVLTLAGGLPIMTTLRALLIASLLGGLALAACGSTGSGGAGGHNSSAAPATAAPALGTNEPKQYPSEKSADPYSGPGY